MIITGSKKNCDKKKVQDAGHSQSQKEKGHQPRIGARMRDHQKTKEDHKVGKRKKWDVDQAWG